MDKLDLKLGDKVGHGFVAPVITPDQYVLGVNSKLPTNVLQANRNWLPFRTGDERQSRNFETFGCTCYNTLKSISQLEKRIYGETKNYSERFIYILAGIKPPGADPHIICETIRKYGLIPEEMLPFDDSITTFEQYADPKAITPEMLDEGFGWKVRNEFMHEWVFDGSLHNLKEKQKRIHESLQYSPLGVSVRGWKERNGMFYKIPGESDNHWTELATTQQNYFHTADDSYDPFQKKLEYDYDFGFMKRYHLRRRTPEEQLAVLNEKKVSGSLFERVAKWVASLDLWPFYSLWKEGKPFNPEVLPTKPKPMPEKIEPTPVEVEKFIEQNPLANWDTPAEARHSTRVICDEMGVSFYLKNVICAVIQAESGFKINAKNENKKNGKVWSTDWGICQINDYWWIGPGKYFASVDEVLNNPEKSIRFIIKQAKAGKLNYWSAFNNESYLRYM